LGQNFLADPNTIRAILARGDLPVDRPILEIGPGLGALTRPLLEAGYRVTAVEVDRGLARYLEEELSPVFPDRFRIVAADILSLDWAELMAAPDPGFNLVGNLPYLISSPVVVRLVEHRQVVNSAVLMFQKELADRLKAGPGTKDYGRLSILLGYYARVEKLLDLGGEVFFPRPKVGSSVLKIVFKETPEPNLLSHSVFTKVLAAGFARRRKTLQNALRSALPAAEVSAALEATGLDPGRRAETLSVEEFVRLANAFHKLGPDPA
jgi:16S rRNA (adenine1518-N6/adenine1519-N6)-dimethyltransferase